MTELNIKLKDFADKIYNPKQFQFVTELYNFVKSLNFDDKSLETAFLIECDLNTDSNTKFITENFGQEVFNNLKLLRRLSNISFSVGTKEMDNLRKSFISLTDDIKIIIIKLAERLISLRIADKEKSENILKLSDECLYFFSPIAQMLGIRKIYNEMEDIAFKNLFPKDFEYLQKKIGEKEQVYNSKISAIRNDLLKMLAEHKIHARLQSRIKRPYSVYRKLKNKGITLDGIYDLLALRVITNSIESCYLTLGLVHSKWVPIEGRFRDWVSYPKPNGYRSIQTTVYTRKGDKFEIQIRTEEMHEEAEHGTSAHWAYKQQTTETKQNIWIQSLREFLEDDAYFDNPHQFFDNLKSEMKRDYINVLTPRGEIVSLPVGATPIDFAYSVHSDLGNKMTGAKVNGKLVKLKNELKSGDLVDIITNSQATPSRDWLGYIKTSRARSKILRWFKKNEREYYIMQGKASWEKLKDQHKRKIQKFESEPKLKENIIKLGYKNFDEFFFAIANGSTKCSLYLLKKLIPDAFKNQEREKLKSKLTGLESLPKVKVEGITNLDTKFAGCCHPIKGEPIIAYITKKGGMKIHSASCGYINSDNIDKSNLKEAKWLTNESYQLVRCKVFGDSYNKMLTSLVNIAEKEDINIISADKLNLKGYKEAINLEIRVKDIAQYESFADKLISSNGVGSIKLM